MKQSAPRFLSFAQPRAMIQRHSPVDIHPCVTYFCTCKSCYKTNHIHTRVSGYEEIHPCQRYSHLVSCYQDFHTRVSCYKDIQTCLPPFSDSCCGCFPCLRALYSWSTWAIPKQRHTLPYSRSFAYHPAGCHFNNKMVQPPPCSHSLSCPPDIVIILFKKTSTMSFSMPPFPSLPAASPLYEYALTLTEQWST